MLSFKDRLREVMPLLLLHLMFIQLDSIHVKLKSLRSAVALLVLISEELSLLCCKVNVGLTALSSHVHLVIKSFILLLYCEALPITSLFINSLAAFHLLTPIPDLIIFKPMELILLFLLELKPLQESHVFLHVAVQFVSLALFFIEQGLLHRVHHMLDMIRLALLQLL